MEGIGNDEGEILLNDLTLPLLSFVVMTIYHDIPRLSVKRDPAIEPDCKDLDTKSEGKLFDALRHRI